MTAPVVKGYWQFQEQAVNCSQLKVSYSKYNIITGMRKQNTGLLHVRAMGVMRRS